MNIRSFFLLAMLAVCSVSARAQSSFLVGPTPASLGGSGGNYSFFADGLVFDCITAFTLDAVRCYPQNNGTVVMNLRDSGGVLLQTYSQPVTGGATQFISPSWSITPGTGYTLDALGTTTALFRSAPGASYPYTVPGAVSITGAINALANNYYFFYAWTITVPQQPAPLWQTNVPEARLEVDRTLGLPTLPARFVSGTTTSIEFLAETSLGLGTPADIVLSLGNIVSSTSSSSFTTLGGKVVGLNLSQPLYSFFGGAGVPIQLTPWAGNIQTSFVPAAPTRVSAQMITLDPSALDGLQLSQPTTLASTPCIIRETFENSTTGNPGTLPSLWSDGGGTYPWRVHSGITTSSATGPTTDRTTGTSGGKYLYCETSAPAVAGDTYILNVRNYATSALGPNSFANFWVHAYGGTIGTIALQQKNSSGVWQEIWARSGNVGDLWVCHQARLLVVPTFSAEMRFVYTRGASFTGDIAIDDFTVCPNL